MSSKLQRIKRQFIRHLLDHSSYISAAAEVAKSITMFAINRNALSFIEGGIGVANVFTQKLTSWSSDYFNTTNGWGQLVDAYKESPTYDIISGILETFPSKTLSFHYNNNDSMAKLYTLPGGDIVGKDSFGIWYYEEESNKEVMLAFLFDEVYKSINSQVFSIVERSHKGRFTDEINSRFILKAEEIHTIASPTATKYLKHIKQAIDKGIRRSIMFVGTPGAGKSTMAHTIVRDLGLRTLKFKYNPNSSDMFAIENIINALKVEVLILDDLDTVESSVDLLGFLERMHDKLKLTIGIVNSIDGFNAALVRPARFDEIITINKLDATVIRGILGSRYKSLYPKVKNWPIAFVNEINERIKIDPKINIAAQVRELDKRVKAQAKSIKEIYIER